MDPRGHPRRLWLPAAVSAILSAILAVPAAAENRSIDGTLNNLQTGSEDFGVAGTPLSRSGPHGYPDGGATLARATGPNPRVISNTIFDQPAGTNVLDPRGLSSMVWQWGQFLDHDIDLTLTDNADTANIPIVPPDLFDPGNTGTQQIAFGRSVFEPGTGTDALNPRMHSNDITHWIDGSNVYGSDSGRAGFLRTGLNGLLKTSPGNLMPFNDGTQANAGGQGTHLFVAGDVRANEQVALTAMHTLFVREHNHWADRILNEHPVLPANPTTRADFIYESARKIVGAEIQVITYEEFLPALFGPYPLDPYTGYDDSVNPTIHNEFSTAAYRLGHSMIGNELKRLNADRTVAAEGHLPLANAFFNPAEVQDPGDIEKILRGLIYDPQQKVDARIVDGLRNFLFGPPPGLDLATLNIQRGRDNGLGSFNEIRVAYGLAPINDFMDLTGDVDVASALESLYGPTLDDLDPWVGMLAEQPMAGSSLPETIYAILRIQFAALRDGDRFWYENDLQNDLGLPDLVSFLNLDLVNTHLSDVIIRNTDIGAGQIRTNVFVVPTPPAFRAGLALFIAAAAYHTFVRRRKRNSVVGESGSVECRVSRGERAEGES